jgi:hypothetical protein
MKSLARLLWLASGAEQIDEPSLFRVLLVRAASEGLSVEDLRKALRAAQVPWNEAVLLQTSEEEASRRLVTFGALLEDPETAVPALRLASASGLAPLLGAAVEAGWGSSIFRDRVLKRASWIICSHCGSTDFVRVVQLFTWESGLGIGELDGNECLSCYECSRPDNGSSLTFFSPVSGAEARGIGQQFHDEALPVDAWCVGAKVSGHKPGGSRGMVLQTTQRSATRLEDGLRVELRGILE